MTLDSSHESTGYESYGLSEKTPLISSEATEEQCIKHARTPTSSPERWTARKVIILALLSFVYFLTWCCFSLWASFFPVEAEKRGVSSTEVGFIYGTYSLVAFLAAFVYGPFIIPRIGPYFVLFAGLFVNGGANIICGFIYAIEEHRLFSIYCFIVRSVGALGGSACETAIVVVVADEFRANINTAIGLLRVFTGLGFIIGPVIGGGLYAIGGFRLPLFVTGSLLLGALPLIWLFLPRKVSDYRDFNNSSRGKPSLSRAMTIPTVAVLSLWYIVGVIAISFIEPILQPYVEKMGVSSTGVGLLFLAISGTYVICTPFVGYVLDKKHLHRYFIIIGAFGIAICLILFGPAPFLTAFIPRKVWTLAVFLALSGAAFSFGLVPVLPELLHCCHERGFPRDISTYSLVSGLYTGFANLGAFIGPAIGGILSGTVGFPWTSAIIGFAVGFKALLLLLFFCFNRHKTFKQDTPEHERLLLSQSYDNLGVYYRGSVSISIDK